MVLYYNIVCYIIQGTARPLLKGCTLSLTRGVPGFVHHCTWTSLQTISKSVWFDSRGGVFSLLMFQTQNIRPVFKIRF